MKYKYDGKEFVLKLNDEGQIECPDLGITGANVDEVKTSIRAQVEKEKSLPRIPVLFFERYRRDVYDQYIKGTTTAKNVSNSRWPQVWVAWKDDRGKTQREKRDVTEIYPDTPENRVILDKFVSLMNQSKELEQKASGLKETAQRIQVINI